MNLQEAFNKIYIHAQKKEKSVATDGVTCKYRGAHGRMCFIGVLIPDDKYDPAFDCGTTTKEVCDVSGLTKYICYDAFYILQNIHDVNEPSSWNAKLDEFAVLRNLTIPTI